MSLGSAPGWRGSVYEIWSTLQTSESMQMVAIMVRPFERQDVGAVLVLMRALAVFEGYDDKFRLTEADLIEHGLGPSPRFGVFVAEREDVIVGIAVHYIIPWTYDLKPVVWLKELYVAEAARGMAVGHALVEQRRQYAADIGASAIKWTVLKSNLPAKAFYRSLGGQPDEIWEPWQLKVDS